MTQERGFVGLMSLGFKSSMNILVTGGCGFIGSAFIRQRLARHDEGVDKIVNLDALTYAGSRNNLAAVENDPRYVFAYGDIGDYWLVTRLLKEHAIDCVVNFAAESHVDHSIDSPEPFFQTNVIGTLRLINCARFHWMGGDDYEKAKFRFLHVSTDEVYGSLTPDAPAFKETTAFAPNSPYAASKAASDCLCRSYFHTYGFPVITTNCSNNYGPYQFPEKLIPRIITRALEGLELTVHGDGQQIRDWIHVDDHCAAIWAVIQRGRVGESYAIGADNEMMNLGVVNAICEILDDRQKLTGERSYTRKIKHTDDRPGNDRRYAIDSAKVRHETGWIPLKRFAQGLAETVEFYESLHF